MADRVEINMSSIKIAGVGGLGMLAMVGVVAYAMPEARQFVLLSYGAGTLGAFAFIAYRRWMKPERPDRPTLITVNAPQPTGERKDRIRGRPSAQSLQDYVTQCGVIRRAVTWLR
jgi:hypothetical protein